MAAPVAFREDFDAVQPPALARLAADPGQVRRLLALAAICDGGSRSAAAIGGGGLPTVRDRVLRFNAEGPEGLVTCKAPGNRPIVDADRRAALRRIVEDGPIPAVDGVVRWRLVDLARWLWKEFRVSISKQTLSREVRRMGSRKLSARPRHRAMPGRGQGGRPRSAPLQHASHGLAPRGDFPSRRARCARRRDARSGGVAHLDQGARARQPHAAATARKVARTPPDRESLAVPARQLRLLPRYPRPLLLRLEQPHQPAPWRITAIGLRDWAHGF